MTIDGIFHQILFDGAGGAAARPQPHLRQAAAADALGAEAVHRLWLNTDKDGKTSLYIGHQQCPLC